MLQLAYFVSARDYLRAFGRAADRRLGALGSVYSVLTYCRNICTLTFLRWSRASNSTIPLSDAAVRI